MTKVLWSDSICLLDDSDSDIDTDFDLEDEPWSELQLSRE